MRQKVHKASEKVWRGRQLAPLFILPLLASAKSQLKAAGRVLHEKSRNDF